MFFRLVLSCLSLFALTACSVAYESKQVQQVTNNKLNQKPEIFIENSVTSKQELEDSVPLVGTSFSTENNSPRSVETSSSLPSYMTLRPTGSTNALGNPLYKLRLYAHGQLNSTYFTVTGRKHTQNSNRNKAGTEAPLPDGMYKVARVPIPGSIPEAGDLFLPIQPSFSTGRSALGIHYDPSFEKNNGEDGTSGCIGLANKQELNEVLNYVSTYQPQYLEVDIQ